MRKDHLYIKVGNSQISWRWGGGRFEYENISEFSISRWRSRLKNTRSIFIFGVVPNIIKKFQETCLKQKIDFKELKLADIPIKPAYKKGIGIDRVLNAWAAYNYFKSACVVVDFGTAVTAEFIDQKGIHKGGFIVIGPRLALSSLHQKTALIPHLKKIKSAKKLKWGQNSLECLSFGHLVLYHGFLGQIHDLALKNLNSRFKILLTGGAGRLFASRQTPYIEELGLRSLSRLQIQ